MCWLCHLRHAEHCGAIEAASLAWGETVYDYAEMHGIDMDEANSRLMAQLRQRPMPERVH